MSFKFLNRVKNNKKFLIFPLILCSFFTLLIVYQNCGGRGAGGGANVVSGANDPIGENNTDNSNNNGDELSKTTELYFTTGQAASVVIGQPDFTSTTSGLDGEHFLEMPLGVEADENGIYISDSGNSRLIYLTPFPTSMPLTNVNKTIINSASGMFSEDLQSGVSHLLLHTPTYLTLDSQALTLTDSFNNRILFYNPRPVSSNTGPSFAMGQIDLMSNLEGCIIDKRVAFTNPIHGHISNNKLIVSDMNNNRVLIWNTIPNIHTAPPHLVLGRTALDDCSSIDENNLPPLETRVIGPSGVWTNGEKLIVVASFDRRILIWNKFPTVSNQAPDLILGEENSTGAIMEAPETLNNKNFIFPIGVISDGKKIYISDLGAGRILVWNTWPSASHQSADVVLGHEHFEYTAAERDAVVPSEKTLGQPTQMQLVGDKLIVADQAFNRVVIFKGEMK